MAYLVLRPDDDKVDLGAWLYAEGLALYARRRDGGIPGEIVVHLEDLEGVTRALQGKLFGARVIALPHTAPHGGPLYREVWLAEACEGGGG